jgi:hypothetical protein
MDDATFGHYVYAVGEATSLATLDGLSGIDDAPVTCVVADALCAVTSPVRVSAFRDAQRAAEVSETSWLAGAVCAHERVVLGAGACGSVLPMRFGTLYAQRADVEAMLRLHQAALQAELHRLAGSTEWCLTVRVSHSPERLPEDEPTALAAAQQPASGTAWMLSRQAALQARQSHAGRLPEQVAGLRAELAAQVRDIAVSRPANGAGDSMRMWLLVDDVARLRAAVDAVRTREDSEGFTVELTGPWPAYHFVRTDALQQATSGSDDQHADRAEVRR